MPIKNKKISFSDGHDVGQIEKKKLKCKQVRNTSSDHIAVLLNYATNYVRLSMLIPTI